jgi:hypothetical protein
VKVSVSLDFHTFTNRYLIDDLQSRLGTDDLLAWLDEEADKLSSEGRAPAGYVHFSATLLQKRKIRRICEAEIIGKACIKPSQDEYYEIAYNPILSQHALRFAIAHEIGHTYWFKPGGGAKPLSPLQRRLGRDPDIEHLCNRFAESLLLPLSEIKCLELQNRAGLPRLDLIVAVSNKYRLQERAVVRKLFGGAQSQLAGIVCLQKLASQRWVTRWCVIPMRAYERRSPSGFGIPLHGKKTVPTQMVPEIPLGKTVTTQGLKQVPASVARIPFDRMSVEESRQAFAFRLSDFIYLGFPKH